MNSGVAVELLDKSALQHLTSQQNSTRRVLLTDLQKILNSLQKLEATPPLDISTKNYKLILLAVPVSDEVFVPSVTSPPLASSRAPAPAPAPAPPLRSTPSSLPELERSSSNAPHPPPLDTAPESKSSHNHTPPNQRNGKSPPAVTPPPSSAPGPISTATAAIGPLLNARSSPPTTPQTEDDGLDGEAEVAAILNTPVPARSQPTTPIQPSQKSSEIPPPPPPPPAVRAANRSGSQTQTQSQAVARAESPLLFGAGSLSPPQPPQPPAPIPTAVLHPPLRPPSLGAAAATIVAPRQSASQQASSPTIPYSSTPLTAPQHTPSQPSTPVVAATAAAAAQPPPNATSGPVTGVEAITKTKPRKSKKAAREFAAAAAAALSVDSSTGRGARSSRSSADWHRALEQAPIIKSWQVGETAPEEQWRFYTKEHKSEWLRDKQDTTTEMTPVHRRALNLFDAENSTQWKSGKHVRKATDTKLYFSLLVSSVPRDLSASPDSDDKKSAPKGSVDTLMAAFAFQIRRKDVEREMDVVAYTVESGYRKHGLHRLIASQMKVIAAHTLLDRSGGVGGNINVWINPKRKEFWKEMGFDQSVQRAPSREFIIQTHRMQRAKKTEKTASAHGDDGGGGGGGGGDGAEEEDRMLSPSDPSDLVKWSIAQDERAEPPLKTESIAEREISFESACRCADESIEWESEHEAPDTKRPAMLATRYSAAAVSQSRTATTTTATATASTRAGSVGSAGSAGSAGSLASKSGKQDESDSEMIDAKSSANTTPSTKRKRATESVAQVKGSSGGGGGGADSGDEAEPDTDSDATELNRKRVKPNASPPAPAAAVHSKSRPPPVKVPTVCTAIKSTNTSAIGKQKKYAKPPPPKPQPAQSKRPPLPSKRSESESSDFDDPPTPAPARPAAPPAPVPAAPAPPAPVSTPAAPRTLPAPPSAAAAAPFATTISQSNKPATASGGGGGGGGGGSGDDGSECEIIDLTYSDEHPPEPKKSGTTTAAAAAPASVAPASGGDQPPKKPKSKLEKCKRDIGMTQSRKRKKSKPAKKSDAAASADPASPAPPSPPPPPAPPVRPITAVAAVSTSTGLTPSQLVAREERLRHSASNPLYKAMIHNKA